MKRRHFAAAAAVVLVGVLGFSKWDHAHASRVSGAGEPASLRCFTCHGPSAHRLPERPAGRAYPSPIALTLDAGGGRLLVSCQGTDEIAVLDPQSGEIVARWPVGKTPHGIASSPDGREVYVALRGEDRIVVLDRETGQETGSVAVGHEPCGLALAPDRNVLVAANSGSDDISLVDTKSRTELCRVPAGREPYAVSIDPRGEHAWILNRMAATVAYPDAPAAEVTAVNLSTRRVVARPRSFSAHLGEGIATATTGGQAFFSLLRVRNLVPITQVAQGWVMTSTLGIAGVDDDEVLQLPLDETNAYFGDPSGVAVDESRGRVYVASGGMNVVTVVDLPRAQELLQGVDPTDGGPWADHLGVSSEYVLARIPVAANPRDLLLSPDGKHLYVAERLASSVAIIDTESLTVVHRFLLADESPDLVRRGERLFHGANVTFQGQFSCRSCHPDGHVDGLAYDFAIDGIGKNILDNRSLLGLAGTAPFKWNGKNRNLFEQCGPRFARVLTRSDPFSPDDLECLVTYILSLTPPAPYPAVSSTLTPAQARGREIFERESTNDGWEIRKEDRCLSCHQPPLYTNRMKAAVGAGSESDTVIEFDVPHLLGIARSAPYLHDGRALTLEEIWTVHGADDSHGIVNDLTKEQLNDLVEFLKAL